MVFEEVRKRLEEDWGLVLTRNGRGGSYGRTVGSWTTGFMVSGHLPWRGMSWIWFRTLKRIVKWLDAINPS